MNALLVLLVAELFVFGVIWHNKSARSGMERNGEGPDPAVLLPRSKAPEQKANEQNQSAQTVRSLRLPPALEQVHHPDHDVCFPRGNVSGIVAKLQRAIRIEIPIGYQDESGFHRIIERPAIKQQMKGQTI